VFKKLLANLAFNPGLIDQVSFYADRFHREAMIRRAGLLFLCLAIAVQALAGLYPASPSFVASPATVEATGKHKPKPPAKVELSKKVENITAKALDANGSTAKAGDILEFKLTTKNIGGVEYKNYKGSDYFGRVLQYAEITDTTSLSTQGLNLDGTGNLSWTTAVIKAGASDVKTIRVKVKSPIPATNTPAPGSADYNCQISNFYGNQVSLSVDCPIVKTVAETATKLPETGSGVSIAIAVGVAVVAGYFYSRSRIMAKELAIVRRDHISTRGDS